MPLRLIHLANFNSTNIGNGALISGTEKVLREDFRRKITWTRVAWDDYTFGLKHFDGDFVRLVNAHDGLVIGGAVAINGRAYLANTGTRVDLPLELWARLEKPVVFHGISYRHWPGQPFYHKDKLKSLVEFATAHPSMLFGCRNDGTRDWLAKLLELKNQEEKIHLVPDPALFVETASNQTYPELSPRQPNILLSFNDEDAECRYGDKGRRAKVIRGLAKAVQRLAEEFEARVVLVPHYFDDYRMLTDFVDACRPQFAHQRVVSTGLLRTESAAYFYGRYAMASLAISMRVHSMSPAIGLGIPVVPLVTQDRMWDFLRDAQLDDLAVNAFADDFSERLGAAAAAALRSPEPLRQRLTAATKQLRERMRAFNSQAEALFA